MRTVTMILIALIAAGCGEGPAPASEISERSAASRTEGTGIEVYCNNDAARDTAALQEAVTEAINGGEIILSNQTCKIDQTINIYGKDGLSIRGQGRGKGGTGTLLEWHGAANAPMFQICRAVGGRLTNLTIMPGANQTLRSAVDIHNYCKGAATTGNDTSGWTLRGVSLSGRGKAQPGHLMYGVRVLPSDMTSLSQVSNLDVGNGGHTFSDVTVTDYQVSGFVFEGSTSRGNTLLASGCRSGSSCVSTYAEDNADLWSGGSFSWQGGHVEGSLDADVVLGEVNGPVMVAGVSSVGSAMLMRHKAHAARSSKLSSFPVYLMGVRFGATKVISSHRTVIDLHHKGPLVITGCTLGSEGDLISEPHDVAVCYRPVDSRGKPGSGAFTFTGNAVVTPKFDRHHQKDNPFAPSGADGCLYPTNSGSNLIYQTPAREWMPMPTHATIHSSSTVARSDAHVSATSRGLYILRNGARLASLTGGTVGQVIRILKFDEGLDDKPAKLQDARAKDTQGGNLYLRTTAQGDASDVALYNGDTVTLMLMRTKGTKSYWYELHRSYNSEVSQ